MPTKKKQTKQQVPEKRSPGPKAEKKEEKKRGPQKDDPPIAIKGG